jgi:hypothetical protein
LYPCRYSSGKVCGAKKEWTNVVREADSGLWNLKKRPLKSCRFRITDETINDWSSELFHNFGRVRRQLTNANILSAEGKGQHSDLTLTFAPTVRVNLYFVSLLDAGSSTVQAAC